MTKLVVGLSLLASTCGACFPNHPHDVPLTSRPDTRRIGIVRLDSTAMRQTLQILQAALPNETSVCYSGHLYDSTVVEPNGPQVTTVLKLDGARESVADSSDEFHVWYSQPWAGCPPSVIAIGHSHPYAGAGLCTHSYEDANVIFVAPRVLASIVWCGDGRSQVLFQDGRRVDGRWRDEG